MKYYSKEHEWVQIDGDEAYVGVSRYVVESLGDISYVELPKEGTDVIVGFPGETDEDFAASLEFVREMAFANIHIFSYSPRPGTPAAQMPDKVDPAVVKERFRQLKSAADESAADFRNSQVGKNAQVIFERADKGILRGWSDNYLPFAVPEGMFPAGKIVNFTAGEEFLEKNSPAE